MAVNESATNRWDAGLAGDFYHIYRGWSWELFRITSGGNVWIWTTSPGAKLNIKGNNLSDLLNITSTTYNKDLLSINWGGFIEIETWGTSAVPDIKVIDSDNNVGRAALQIQGDKWNKEIAWFASNGNVWIWTINPGVKLQVNWAIYTNQEVESWKKIPFHIQPTSNWRISPYIRMSDPNNSSFWDIQITTWWHFALDYLDNQKFKISNTWNLLISWTLTQNSDERLKENIEIIEWSLEKIAKIDWVRYNWKDTESRWEEKQIWVVAQDIENVFPELVVTDDSEEWIKSVNYAWLVAPLIEAVKELKKENEELRKRVDVLEK